MPIQACSEGGKPGFQWGGSGKCYTYAAGDKDAMNEAKRKAVLQGVAATGGKGEGAAFVKLMDVATIRLEGRRGHKRELAEDVLKAWNRKLFSKEKEKDKKKGQKC